MLAAPLLHCAGVWQDAQRTAEFPCFTLVTMRSEYAKFNLWQGPAHRWRFDAPPPVHEIAGRRCSLLRPACGRRRVLTSKLPIHFSPITTDLGSAGGSEADVGERLHLADWRRPALGTARPKPAIQDVALNVSKVASKSSAGAPALGHNRSFPTRFQILSRRTCERQVSGDESDAVVGSSRPPPAAQTSQKSVCQ